MITKSLIDIKSEHECTDNNNNIFLKNIKREGDAMSVVAVNYGYILWLIEVQYWLVSTS